MYIWSVCVYCTVVRCGKHRQIERVKHNWREYREIRWVNRKKSDSSLQRGKSCIVFCQWNNIFDGKHQHQLKEEKTQNKICGTRYCIRWVLCMLFCVYSRINVSFGLITQRVYAFFFCGGFVVSRSFLLRVNWTFSFHSFTLFVWLYNFLLLFCGAFCSHSSFTLFKFFFGKKRNWISPIKAC